MSTATDETPSGHPTDPTRAALVAHMAAMAADRAMVLAFLDEFGDRLRGLVRYYLTELARRDLANDPDEVDGLVIDVALVLADRAGAWHPDGALPWVWAGRAIRSAIASAIGHARADVDLDHLDELDRRGASPPPASGGDDSLHGLVERLGDPRLQLLLEAIGEGVADAHQRDVYVEFRLQKLQGDPSPSATVAPQFGLTTDNVRQIASRSHRRVRALVETDDRYLTLRDLAWFAA